METFMTIDPSDIAKLYAGTTSAPIPATNVHGVLPAIARQVANPAHRTAGMQVAGNELNPLPMMQGPLGGGMPIQTFDDQKLNAKQMESWINAVSGSDVITRTVREQASSEPMLAEAFNTQYDGSKVVIGDRYEIRIKPTAEAKSFDVVDSVTNQIIADNLCIYEAAYGIVKLLNKGYAALDPHIRKIVFLEQQYYNAKGEAIVFKKKVQKAKTLGESRNADINAAKFQNAKTVALNAKNQISKIVESL